VKIPWILDANLDPFGLLVSGSEKITIMKKMANLWNRRNRHLPYESADQDSRVNKKIK